MATLRFTGVHRVLAVATALAVAITCAEPVSPSRLADRHDPGVDVDSGHIKNLTTDPIVVELDASSIEVGDTTRAHATLNERRLRRLLRNGRRLIWTSSDTTVARVTRLRGLVRGIGTGTATITASIGGESGSADVTVVEGQHAPVASVGVALAATTIPVGASTTASAVLRDANGAVLPDRAVSWMSADPAVVMVDATTGNVLAMASGTTDVIAVSEGVTGRASITVTGIAVASVTVTLESASLRVGESTQGTAVTRDADNNVLTGRAIVWRSDNAAVASVDSATGRVTARSAGTANVSATSEGVSGQASATVQAAAVASVTVALASSSLEVGQTTTATATLRDASNNVLTGRTVAWSSANAAVARVDASTGQVTAVAAGTTNITATSEGVSGSTGITVTAEPPPPPPPPVSGVADPTLLPAATAQRPMAGSYGRNLAAGQRYNDPLTGVTVLKLTSASVPNANGGVYHGYSEGGPVISQAWVGGDGNTYYTAYIADGWLVDIRYDTFASSNWRRAPIDGEINWTFSLNPSTPRIGYFVDDGNDKTVHRYNTATNRIEDTGIFPYTPSAAGSSLSWLQVNLNDQWLVGMLNGNATVVAVRLSDGLQRSYPTSFYGGIDTDEPHIDREFPVVYISTNDEANLVVNLETNTVVAETDPQGIDAADHESPLRGKVIFINYTVDGLVSTDRNGVVKIEIQPSPTDWSGDYHQAGQWIFNNPDQWFVIDQWARDGNYPIRRGMIGFVRPGGNGNPRLIVAHDATGTGYDTGGQVHPTLSPDGKLLMWTSNMNGSARYDVFVARIPTR